MKIIIKFLLVLLLIWPVYAQSQEPPPRPFKDVQVQNVKTSETNNKSNTSQKVAAKSLTVVNPRPAVLGDMQSKNKEENHLEESFYNRLVGWSTVTLAFVTTILAIFTYKLWSATKDTAKRQLRAYVFMKLEDGQDMFYNPNGCLSIALITKNFGQTPAYDISCTLQMALHKFPLTTTLPHHKYEQIASKSPLAPTDKVYHGITLGDKLTQGELDNILAGKAAIFIWGEVIYFDAFKTRQKSSLCLYSIGEGFVNGRLAYYHEGNEAT
jgi:hypothetical protein